MSVPTECVSAHEEFFAPLGASASSCASTASATATASAAVATDAAAAGHHKNGADGLGSSATAELPTASPIAGGDDVVPEAPSLLASASSSPARGAPRPPSSLPLKLAAQTPFGPCCGAAAAAAAVATAAPTTNGNHGSANGNTTTTSTARTTATDNAAAADAAAAAAAASSTADRPPASPASPPSASNQKAAAVDATAASGGEPPAGDEPLADLLRWKDMPRHLQFNRYIVEGYRPLTDAKGCVHSLFYFHNETVNILTHGIPVLYILATVPYLLPWDDFRWLSWCHLLGTLAPWCGSFVYHLFMNLDQGEVVYYRLLKLDMFGIWMSQSFGAITFVTATAFCWKLRTLVIGGYCILCLWGLYKALLAASPWQRRLCFLFPFVMRLHLVVLRCLKMAGGNTESMVHVYLQDGVSIVGGAIGAMNIPEKWLPGNVDFFLNSHNIMHVLVVVAVYSMHQASMRDMEWMSKSGCVNGVGPSNDSLPLDVLGGLHHTEL